MCEPVNFLLEESPLVGGLSLLLKQPGVVFLLLQYLHHGFPQVIAILLEHKILNYEWDLVGETVAGFLEDGVRRLSCRDLGLRPVAAEKPGGSGCMHGRLAKSWWSCLPNSCSVSNHGKVLSGLPNLYSPDIPAGTKNLHGRLASP